MQLTCIYNSREGARQIKRVKLTPDAGTVLIQDVLPDDTQTVRFHATSTWRELCNVPLPRREPCTQGRAIGALFLSPSRCVIAHGSTVLLTDGASVVWRMSLPLPIEWLIDPLRVYPNAHDWEVMASGDPKADTEQLYVPTYWTKNLGSSSYFYEPECEDRSATEIMSIDDGHWIGRVDVDETPDRTMSTERFRASVRELRRVELVRDGAELGVLYAPEGRLILDASYVDRRVIVAMSDGELLYFAVDE